MKENDISFPPPIFPVVFPECPSLNHVFNPAFIVSFSLLL